MNKLPHHMQTCMVFAARYAHHRDTGGALAICTAIRDQWANLDGHTQDQILRESHEATCNLEHWQQLRDFAITHNYRRQNHAPTSEPSATCGNESHK